MNTVVHTMTPGIGVDSRTLTYSLGVDEALAVAYATWKRGGVRTGMPDFEAALAVGRSLVRTGSDGRTRQIILTEEPHVGRAWFARAETKVVVVRGDITQQEGIDAIVNAAHPSLLGGGGVDGCIHRAAGWRLRDACEQFAAVDTNEATNHVLSQDPPRRSRTVRCPVGAAVMTPAFDLKAKMIIHTVGPLFPGRPVEDSERDLAAAYTNSLREAVAYGARTVAFPAISCGVFGFPPLLAASVVANVLHTSTWNLDEVRFVLFDADVFEAFRDTLQKYGDIQVQVVGL